MHVIASFGFGRLYEETIRTALSQYQMEMASFPEIQDNGSLILLVSGVGTIHEIAERIQHVREIAPAAKVILIGMENVDESIVRCIQEGACAFLSCRHGVRELVEAIDMVQRDRTSCSGPVTRMVLNAIHKLSHDSPPAGTYLTPREVQILTMIQDGLSNKEIARNLNITHNTVKNHVHHLLEKLKIRSRHEAADVQVRPMPAPMKLPQNAA